LLAIGFALPFESTVASTTVVAPMVALSKENSIFLRILQAYEPKLRERMLEEGFPAEAVDEFFTKFLCPPYHKNQFNEMVQWAKKWEIKDHEKLEEINVDEIQKLQTGLADEFSSIFENLNIAAGKVSRISRAEIVHLEDINDLIGSGRALEGRVYNEDVP
ncbi:hypothetical protein PFISCL1PPCAC_27929, partial [Pristionchus fissidentatus]